MLYTAAANKHPLISIGYASKGAHFLFRSSKNLENAALRLPSKILEGPRSGIL